MTETTVPYPAAPGQVDEAILKPTAAFKKEVFNVLGAILFFIAVYLLLAVAAVLLGVLCGYGGIMLIINVPKLVTLAIGIGMVGLGVMVIFFLFKFLFKEQTIDRSNLFEVKEQEQPELFAFIRNLTNETQTSFPKKIYLSVEVNAAVFYDSSFWSMILPVRKNLQIGLGLVNCVNLSEFKAILAHEFGHFSQRSMKLGSYVYNVNRVIHNQLYDNESYGQTLESWANVNGYFAFFAGATARIVAGIQWIMQKVYAVVNKRYMGLSRQMEFHADTVAAYVTGANHLINSLRRLEVADAAYNSLFDYYNIWYKQNLKPDNLFPQHAEVMKQLAIIHSLPLENGLPQVNANSFARYNKARITIKDQWASHPGTDDREAHLRSLNIYTESVQLPAWRIFRHAEELQRQMTDEIYKAVTFEGTPQTLDLVSFKQRYGSEIERGRVNGRYQGFFDTRDISATDFNRIDGALLNNAATLDDLLDGDTLNLPYLINGLKSDIATLENVGNGSIPIQTFEFEGKKYGKKESDRLLNQLKDELTHAEKQLAEADARIIAYFLRAAQKHGQAEALQKKYNELFYAAGAAEEGAKNYMAMMHDISPIYQQRADNRYIHHIMEKIGFHEGALKNQLKELMSDDRCHHFFSDDERRKMDDYLADQHERRTGGEFLNFFVEALTVSHHALMQRSLAWKKELLEWQLSFLD